MRILLACLVCIASLYCEIAFCQVVVLGADADPGSRARFEDLRLRVFQSIKGQVREPQFLFVSQKNDQTSRDVVRAALMLKPTLLVVNAAVLAREARLQSSTLPIVFQTVFDPVATGLVESATAPKNNMTGYSTHAFVHEKRWELLVDAIPSINNVGVLVHESYFQGIGKRSSAVDLFGRKFIFLNWKASDGYSILQREVKKNKLDGLDVGLGVLKPNEVKDFVRWTQVRGLATIFDADWYCQSGGLLSYEGVEEDAVKIIAQYVSEILLGAQAGDLPIRYPKSFALALNPAAAKRLNLKFSSAFLRRVDRIVTEEK